MLKLRLGLAFLVIVAAGCAPNESAVEAGNRTQTLHIGNLNEPPDLDPHTMISPAYTIGSSLHEGLVRMANDGTTIIPGLAERWEISPDGRRYTFHLRHNAKWSNGEPIVAADYVAGIQRFFNPALGCEGVNRAFMIVGAQDYAEGKNPDFSSVGVTAPDDQTVEIHLSARTPYFLEIVADAHLVPLYRPMLEAFDGLTKRGGKWTSPGNMVSSGPFILKTWKPNVVVAVEKNPHYWQAEAVKLYEIHFHPIEDFGVEERAFRAGQLHVTYGLPASKIGVYRERGAPELRSTPVLSSEFITFMTTRPPFDDSRVRRAFSLAIDRDALMNSVLPGRGVPAYTYTPPFAGGYDLPPFAEYDQAEARRLLAEAGYPEGVGFPDVELGMGGRDEEKMAIGQAVQQMWKQTLGVQIQLAPMEYRVWLDLLRSQSMDLSLSNWSMSINDPTNILALAVSGDPNNDAYWSNARYDAAFAAIEQAEDEAARRAAIIECERIINDEAPWAPLFIGNRNRLAHPTVQGWQDNLVQKTDWTTLSLRAD